MLINAHCHIQNIVPLNLNTRLYISNPLDKAQVAKHLAFQQSNILISTGQHPYYYHNSITNQFLIDLLEEGKIWAVGEIGLDKRNPDHEGQKKVLLEQLDIAKQFHRPIIIHCVGKYYDLYNIIKHNFPHERYIFHFFQGSLDIIKSFAPYRIIYSIHQLLMNRKKSTEILKVILNQHDFLFETDDDVHESNDISITIQKIALFTNHKEGELARKQQLVFESL